LISGKVKAASQDPRDIDLSTKDWQEIPEEPRKRLRRKSSGLPGDTGPGK
jgi:hypothetical protein